MLKELAAPITAGASSLINGITSIINTNKTNKANRELAEYSYSKNLESWHMQNAYNTPEKQMERFKAAGLNPNLIYGQGNAGNAAQIPQYQAPEQSYNYRPPVDPLAMLGAYQDFRMKQAATKTAEAEAQAAERYFRERAKVQDWKSNTQFAESQIKEIIRDMMANSYKNVDENGNPTTTPTPWQSYSLDAIKWNARQAQENALLIGKRTTNLETQTKLMQLEIDNFLTRMWSSIITNGINSISRFR